ncbi:Glutaredoxin-C6 (Glutaredoxin-C2 homolog 1) [Durusdinium trenchii]|uniref:Glutaredoxin-C6 (Glutaredoxin-C2 homolog 1) n=1 Tax=Durusdinium trenchii TaxID=1381693 RepID=A0ABP0HNH4_9DINO
MRAQLGACVIVLPFFLGFVNFSTPPPPARSTEIEVDGAQYIPLKVASFAMGALKPFFQVQASVQAGRYDKWDVRKEIEEEIKSAPVVIYTYDWSPFSAEAKKVLDSMGADYREVSLGAEWFLASPQQAAKRAELGNLYGRTSMPHIFIGGRSVGGLIDGEPGLVPLQETGELTDSLKQAGALPDEGLFGFFLYSGDHRP